MSEQLLLDAGCVVSEKIRGEDDHAVQNGESEGHNVWSESLSPRLAVGVERDAEKRQEGNPLEEVAPETLEGPLDQATELGSEDDDIKAEEGEAEDGGHAEKTDDRYQTHHRRQGEGNAGQDKRGGTDELNSPGQRRRKCDLLHARAMVPEA